METFQCENGIWRAEGRGLFFSKYVRKIELNTEIVHILSSVERLVDPPLYYAKELDEAIQVRR